MVPIPAKVISTEPTTCAATAPSAQEMRPCCNKVVTSAETLADSVEEMHQQISEAALAAY